MNAYTLKFVCGSFSPTKTYFKLCPISYMIPTMHPRTINITVTAYIVPITLNASMPLKTLQNSVFDKAIVPKGNVMAQKFRLNLINPANCLLKKKEL